MSDSDIVPSFPPLSPPPGSSHEGEDGTEIDTCTEFISNRLKKQREEYQCADNIQVSIQRVPDGLRQGKNNVYEPRIISIGTYHRGNRRLQKMEKNKFPIIEEILSQNSHLCLKDLIIKLMPLEKQVRRCYSDKYKKLKRNEFVEMMLLDSCFILYLLASLKTEDKTLISPLVSPLIYYDLLLLENQLPFFLLEYVYDIINTGEQSPSLFRILYNFHRRVTHEEIYIDENIFLDKKLRVHHLLQFYHWVNVSPLIRRPLQEPKNGFCKTVLKWLKKSRPSDDMPTKKSDEAEEGGIMIPNATELVAVGIKFKKNTANGVLEVKFKNGILEIPPLLIDDGALSLFQNLIVLEQCMDLHLTDIPQFRVYFKFMDHIINTDSDVKLLLKNNIIEHTYGSEKEVAHLFNRLTRGATVNPNNYLSVLYKDVNRYCKRKRHIWWAIFLRRHCSNPWTILSLVGVLILLAFAFIQSSFSVYSYFRPSSKSPS
ncbi:hypothetical protein AAC387_Pa04g2464 [Persea americana]